MPVSAAAAMSMDACSQREMRFSRDGAMYRRALAAARRHAHEFARQDEYARDTSFYSQMAGPETVVATRISGLSVDAARTISGELWLLHAAPLSSDIYRCCHMQSTSVAAALVTCHHTVAALLRASCG